MSKLLLNRETLLRIAHESVNTVHGGTNTTPQSEGFTGCYELCQVASLPPECKEREETVFCFEPTQIVPPTAE